MLFSFFNAIGEAKLKTAHLSLSDWAQGRVDEKLNAKNAPLAFPKQQRMSIVAQH